MITVDIDSIKQQRYIISPPQLRLKCAQERDYIYIYIIYRQGHGQTSPTASHDITSFVGQRRDAMRWPPAI